MNLLSKVRQRRGWLEVAEKIALQCAERLYVEHVHQRQCRNQGKTRKEMRLLSSWRGHHDRGNARHAAQVARPTRSSVYHAYCLHLSRAVRPAARSRRITGSYRHQLSYICAPACSKEVLYPVFRIATLGCQCTRMR